LACLFVLLSLLGACRSGDGRGEQELVVFAAASLTDAMHAIEKDFEAEHPGVDVKLNLAGSQSLRTQIENGARPQLFASANVTHMDALRDKSLVDEPAPFVRNELVIVVPKGNPAGVASFADLPNAPKIVLAAENVPAGSYAEKALKSASGSSDYGDDFAKRVRAHVVSRENHVRQTLQKVVLGEADAAIVYATDARSAGDKVETIAIPKEHNVVAEYPIATVRDAPHQRLATVFLDFVRSKKAAKRFEEFGFRSVETTQ
jgi:molybdate transport system substrate-binding protein